MLHPDKAMEMIRNIDHRPEGEEIPILDALGRVLAEKVYSKVDYPPFSKAAMDGYAVHSADSSKCFRLIDSIAAGDVPVEKVHPGECIKIMTGAMMPAGADKVIRVEYTEEKNGAVTVIVPEPYLNVIKKAENLKIGECVMEPKIIKPQDIGVLAGLGIAEIKVARPPLMGIIATGSELKDPGEELEPGEIYNSNGLQLCAQAVAAGCEPRYYGSVLDDPDSLQRAILTALNNCDVVLLTGGVSMGVYDFVPRVLKENGIRILFHKMAVKPGKPTLFAQRENKYVFGLPGNPVSTFIIFEVFVKLFLYRWMGLSYEPDIIRARLTAPISRRDSERVEYRPVKVINGEIYPIKYHGSAHLNALGETNGLIRIEVGNNELKEGTELDVRQI